MGACVPAPVSDAGIAADASRDSGGNLADAGANLDAGARDGSADARIDARSGDSGFGNGSGACGCRTVGGTGIPGSGVALLAPALIAIGSRRRRRVAGPRRVPFGQGRTR
jgi:hypothetical protein